MLNVTETEEPEEPEGCTPVIGEVLFRFTVYGVDFTILTADDTLAGDFQASLSVTLAEMAGPGVTPCMVRFFLSDGSVLVDSYVGFGDFTSSEVVIWSLQNVTDFEEQITESVENVPDIGPALTGNVSVSPPSEYTVVSPPTTSTSEVSTTTMEEVTSMPAAPGEWLVGNWSSCSTLCGEGVRVRQVLCSTGTGCNASVVPPDSEPCEGQDCPFNILCPLGEGGSMACDTQVAMSAAAPAALLMCCMMTFLSWRLYKKGKVPRGGRAQIKDGMGKPVYVEWERFDEDEGASKASTEKAKTRILWKVKAMGGLDRFLNTTSKKADGGDTASEVPSSLEDGFETPQLPAGSSSGFVRSDGRGRLRPLEEGYVGAFGHGTRVEYYSRTNGIWLAGTVHVMEMPAIMRRSADGEMEALYNVTVGMTAQPRFNVPLKFLRTPLHKDEPVNMYSTTRDRWMKAHIDGHQPIGVTTTGYTVLIDKMEGAHVGSVSGVPPTRLIRRFTPGDHVQAYRGAVKGWLAAVVVKPEEVAAGVGALSSEPAMAEAEQPEFYVAYGDEGLEEQGLDDMGPAASKMSRQASEGSLGALEPLVKLRTLAPPKEEWSGDMKGAGTWQASMSTPIRKNGKALEFVTSVAIRLLGEEGKGQGALLVDSCTLRFDSDFLANLAARRGRDTLQRQRDLMLRQAAMAEQEEREREEFARQEEERTKNLLRGETLLRGQTLLRGMTGAVDEAEDDVVQTQSSKLLRSITSQPNMVMSSLSTLSERFQLNLPWPPDDDQGSSAAAGGRSFSVGALQRTITRVWTRPGASNPAAADGLQDIMPNGVTQLPPIGEAFVAGDESPRRRTGEHPDDPAVAPSSWRDEVDGDIMGQVLDALHNNGMAEEEEEPAFWAEVPEDDRAKSPQAARQPAFSLAAAANAVAEAGMAPAGPAVSDSPPPAPPMSQPRLLQSLSSSSSRLGELSLPAKPGISRVDDEVPPPESPTLRLQARGPSGWRAESAALASHARHGQGQDAGMLGSMLSVFDPGGAHAGQEREVGGMAGVFVAFERRLDAASRERES